MVKINETEPKNPPAYGGVNGGDNSSWDVKKIAGLLREARWSICCLTLICLTVALIYYLLTPRIYYADALIQVEEDRPSLSGLSELSEVFSAESEVGAEKEIIRSRSVLGEVVDNLDLDLEIALVQFPILGKAASMLTEKWGGKQWFSSGQSMESIEYLNIRRFEVSPSDEEVAVYITPSGDQFDYLVGGKNNELHARGRLDETESFVGRAGRRELKFVLNIREMTANEGTRFEVKLIPRLSAIKYLKKMLSVAEVGRDTGIIRISMLGDDPKLIERTLHEISDVYVRRNVERKSAEAQQSLEFLNKQLPEVRSNLGLAENKLANFRERNKTIDLTIETEAMLGKMVDFEKRISELELKRSELRRIYTPDHPIIQTLNEQKTQLSEDKKRIEEQTTALPELQQELLRLVREVEVTTELYTFLLNKVQELKVVEAGTVGNVRVIDPAEVQPDPVKPNLKSVIFLAVLSGCFSGLLFVLLRRALRSGITDPELVEGALSMPVYAVMPYQKGAVSKRAGTRSVVVDGSSQTVLAEAFRSLVTSVYFGVSGKGGVQGVVIAISGPAPNVGKTFVSTNLSRAISQSGKSVLFVDADLRRGDAAKVFGVDKRVGLSDLLIGARETATQSANDQSALKVISRGKSPPNPVELLLSERFEQLMSSWRNQYDYIIVDTPPVLAVTDPVVISKCADFVLLVGRAGETKLHELIESKNRFNKGGIKINGLVINGMTESMAAGHDKGYGYGYYSYEYTRLSGD